MRTLFTTTAITFALAMTNVAIASTSFTQMDDTYKIEVTLQAELPVNLIVNDHAFIRGDFLRSAEVKLTGLIEEDMYTGMGSAELSTIRSVT